MSTLCARLPRWIESRAENSNANQIQNKEAIIHYPVVVDPP